MNNIILNQISKIVIPFIQVFGVYIILNGHILPGGGFAGGTVVASSLILLKIINKKDKKIYKLNYQTCIRVLSFSIVGYGLLKAYSIISGGSGLYLFDIPLGQPGRIISGGFLVPLNIFVGVIVAITVYIFFSLFYEGEI